MQGVPEVHRRYAVMLRGEAVAMFTDVLDALRASRRIPGPGVTVERIDADGSVMLLAFRRVPEGSDEPPPSAFS